jgi:hypothetical protein
VTLDELLEGRDAMTRFLEEDAVPKASRFGVRVERVGLKDVVLPGEMKSLLNRVIEAEKEAAANVILRREETAATRSLANTARVMADQPMLLRLKELENMKEIAERIQELRLVVGADSLKALLPADLLGQMSSFVCCAFESHPARSRVGWRLDVFSSHGVVVFFCWSGAEPGRISISSAAHATFPGQHQPE